MRDNYKALLLRCAAGRVYADARKHKGLTQYQIDGTSQTTIARYEQGHNGFGLLVMLEIAKQYDRNPGELVMVINSVYVQLLKEFKGFKGDLESLRVLANKSADLLLSEELDCV